MNGKGDKRRPSKVDQNTFDSNWDRIFSEKVEVPSGMWEHNCKHNGNHLCEIGSVCNWCGMKEDGSFD
jgi:hypothetical protein